MPKGIPVHKLSNIDHNTMTADCAKCGPNAPFKLKAAKAGRIPRCRASIRESKRTVKSRHHGLTGEEALRLKQLYPCAVCGSEKVEDLRIDHCHKTGEIRGVLCNNHNLVLGLIEDDAEVLTALRAYLASPPLRTDAQAAPGVSLAA